MMQKPMSIQESNAAALGTWFDNGEMLDLCFSLLIFFLMGPAMLTLERTSVECVSMDSQLQLYRLD